jgi:hypothetical protein
MPGAACSSVGLPEGRSRFPVFVLVAGEELAGRLRGHLTSIPSSERRGRCSPVEEVGGGATRRRAYPPANADPLPAREGVAPRSEDGRIAMVRGHLPWIPRPDRTRGGGEAAVVAGSGWSGDQEGGSAGASPSQTSAEASEAAEAALRFEDDDEDEIEVDSTDRREPTRRGGSGRRRCSRRRP